MAFLKSRKMLWTMLVLFCFSFFGLLLLEITLSDSVAFAGKKYLHRMLQTRRALLEKQQWAGRGLGHSPASRLQPNLASALRRNASAPGNYTSNSTTTTRDPHLSANAHNHTTPRGDGQSRVMLMMMMKDAHDQHPLPINRWNKSSVITAHDISDGHDKVPPRNQSIDKKSADSASLRDQPPPRQLVNSRVAARPPFRPPPASWGHTPSLSYARHYRLLPHGVQSRGFHEGSRRRRLPEGVRRFPEEEEEWGRPLPEGARQDACKGCFQSDFPAMIENPKVCADTEAEGGERVDLLMVILTTHTRHRQRQAIRDTWASYSRNNTGAVRSVFLLGRRKESEMAFTRQEQTKYGDIIMYDFKDSYSNLTLKTLTAMRWAVRFCSDARFLLKVDDDMWINVPELLTVVRRDSGTLQTVIGGGCRHSARPIRNPRSKWYASVQSYPRYSYPGFCSGTAYVTSLNVARHVISVSPDVPFFHLEDVYMALCIQRLGPPFMLKKFKGFLHGHAHGCKLRSSETISVHGVTADTLRQIFANTCPREIWKYLSVME